MAKEADINQFIQDSFKRFNAACAERHAVGEQEYGYLAFLSNDVLSMAKEELADLANYARYMYTKIEMMEKVLKDGGFFYVSGGDSTGSASGNDASSSSD